MSIRKFRQEDAKQVSDIVKKSFLLSSKYYSPESIQEQIQLNSPENLIEKAKKVNYFVVEEKDRILGIGGYDKEKVYTLFVEPGYHRKGIGGKILNKILSEAKKEGIKQLDSWSTFLAEKFYALHGFEKIKIFTLKCKNSSINFVLMRIMLQ